MENDNIIVENILNGNKNAFRIIVEKYKNYVFALCFNILRNNNDAENASQDAFINIYRSLPKYKYRGFKSWIARITVNKAIDYKRKIDRQKKCEITYLDELDNNLYSDDCIEEQVIKDEEKKRLHILCNQLPRKYSLVLNKYYMESKSYKEIASEENITVKAVETRLYRARKILKDKYIEGGG